MSLEKFKIILMNDNKPKLSIVSGERININNINCFVFKSNKGDIKDWCISHLETGFRLVSAFTKELAISFADVRLKRFPDAIIKAKKRCNELGIKIPVNV